MASGDAVGSIENINDDAAITIKPGAGIEWIVHNLFVPDGSPTNSVQVHVVDGSGSMLIGEISSSMLQMTFHISNTQWLTMTNKTGGTILLGYDGIVVK